ncbi:MAG TPA: DUF3750 domain-containing protein [Xanthobacteraceae bacterium]|nr:DUF3750 domain-containing protein [Xanthobacteraceae bacterium]
MSRPVKLIPLLLLFLFVLPLAARAALFAFEERPMSWRNADWSSVGMLPKAKDHPEARVLVFSGRTGGLKGLVAVHSWVVLKHEGATTWTRYDVVGWGSPVRRNGWAADGRWYGDIPYVIVDVRGAEATALIPEIEAAIKEYRYANSGDYRMWPGPNSNTFVAAVLRAVPELGATLPPNAIGKDFRDEGFYVGLTDSRTGVELSLWGVLGVKFGWVEGLEFNLLGLVAGLDIRHPALKLPGFGRIGAGFPLAGAPAAPEPVTIR